MFILGISAFYHDSAACLIEDGNIIAAAQEERFSRIKHDACFPANAIKYCLKEAKINYEQITNIVFYEKPFLKFERLLETYLEFAPKGFKSFCNAMPVWINDKIFQKSLINKNLKNLFGNKTNWNDKLLFSEHHLSHAASAYYPSPFESAAILTIDGVGEWTTTSVAIGRGGNIKVLKELKFPHSLGLLYSAFTSYLGFKVNSGEYKVMGLAAYGKPIYSDLIKRNLIEIAEDGTFHLDMNYFSFATGLTMTNNKFSQLFGGPPRKAESSITQREKDLAASIQKVTEEIIIKLAKGIATDTGEKNLCLAGGVALNCVANGILMRKKIFEKVWVQPAAGDSGGALGAALSVWHLYYNQKRKISSNFDSMKGAYLGPRYTNEEIEQQLRKCGAIFKKLDNKEILEKTTDALIKGQAVGWMQGRMEFGPRALGARSILADPRSPLMQKQLNLKIKFRESFRPFAPSILYDDVRNWYENEEISPYMLFTTNLKNNKRANISEIPAVTHVDNTARIQTVHQQLNDKFYKLLKLFKKKTGCPILINTSFNIRGEPIVCSPIDAFRCFMSTDLDQLIIENYFIEKTDQKHLNYKNYLKKYELD